MNIKNILHVSVISSNIENTKAFYEGVLGLVRSSERPQMNFDGVWYELGDGQQMHILCVPNPEQGLVRPEHGGRDRHVALAVDNLAALCERLDRNGIAYTLSRSGRPALFCRDPDDNTLEFVESRNCN